METSTWEEVGTVAVDTGKVMLIDPCYIGKNPELGCVIAGFGGDGTYTVLVQRDEKGRVVEAKIVF